MSIAALASNIWHSATSALTTPRAETASFSPAASKPKAAQPTPTGNAPSEQRVLDDLQSWILAQQQNGPSQTVAKARAAYAATSALGHVAS
jgi:hypothetical protein